jgi:hypothetical protein
MRQICYSYSLVGLDKGQLAIGNVADVQRPANITLNILGDTAVAVTGELALGGA